MPPKTMIEYRDGRELSRRVVSIPDADAERDGIPEQLRNSIKRLTTIIAQCDAIANQQTAPTAAQVRGLAGALGDVARGLRWMIKRDVE